MFRTIRCTHASSTDHQQISLVKLRSSPSLQVLGRGLVHRDLPCSARSVKTPFKYRFNSQEHSSISHLPISAPGLSPSARGAAMEQGMADLPKAEFEFFKLLLPGMAKNELRLPAKFTGVLGDRRDLTVRLSSEGAMPLWDVELVTSGDGVYLGRGWRQFARTYDLGEGHLLVFRYDNAAVLNVTVFDPSICRKQYPRAGGAGSAGAGRNAPHVNEPAHFAVTLRNCNLSTKQNQYLNVPVEFQDAHGYARRRQVVLRMGGRSWTVNLKRGKRPFGDRTAFKYGWHQFCVDNGLEVGDTCFFHVVHEHKALKEEEEEDDDDVKEERVKVEEDDGHALKVVVRKKDGAFVA